MELVITSIWAAAVAILIYRAIAQSRLLPDARQNVSLSPPPASSVLVVVPARDESLNIAACIDALSRQTYPRSRIFVRVVDDHSSDDTLRIAHRATSRHEGFCAFASPPLPPRWVGKSHACWTGATQDIHNPPEWICFIDADVAVEPGLLVTAIKQAEAQSLDLLSLAPKQILGTWTERLVLPCGLFCLAFCQNLKKLQSEECADTTVTGQFLLVRAESYFSVGGHQAVASAICEDVALARRLKQHGGRVALLDGRELLSTRMYRDWRALRAGLAKNLVETFGGPARTIWTAMGAVLLAWAAIAIPLIDASACALHAPFACEALGLALTASTAAFGLHLAGARFFGIPLWVRASFSAGVFARRLDRGTEPSVADQWPH
ncbi:glycosyltransferase family 2 protein [Methylocystis sp. IM4]|uniref:glycosyltransferase n=1 Tax=Methylocystis sp. IM4 TaxID=3136560 RepID=UPI00311A4A6F